MQPHKCIVFIKIFTTSVARHSINKPITLIMAINPVFLLKNVANIQEQISEQYITESASHSKITCFTPLMVVSIWGTFCTFRNLLHGSRTGWTRLSFKINAEFWLAVVIKRGNVAYPIWKHILAICFMPPPLGAGGIMFSGCPSIPPSVCPKPEIPSFDLYMGLLVHWTNRNRFTACPPVRPSVCPSVRPSREVSGHLPENAWRDWPGILHADISWPPSELFCLWPQSVDFSNCGTILT